MSSAVRHSSYGAVSNSRPEAVRAILRRMAHAMACAMLFFGAVLGSINAHAQDKAPGQTPTPAANTTPGAPAAAKESELYVIGPGDGIQIFVWRNPELSTIVPVRPDGRISTPLVEDLVAVGKTPAQLARDIEARLSEYVRNPQVNVIVSTAVGAFSQIKVVGQVRSPQSLQYREGMTVIDVALAVGGLTEFAAGNRAKLVRTDKNGKQQTFKIKLESLLTKGRMSENLKLEPGDVIIVPAALF